MHAGGEMETEPNIRKVNKETEAQECLDKGPMREEQEVSATTPGFGCDYKN